MLRKSVQHPIQKTISHLVGWSILVFAFVFGSAVYLLVYTLETEDASTLEKEIISTNLIQASVGIFAENDTILQDVASGLMSTRLIDAVRVFSNDKLMFVSAENLVSFDGASRYQVFAPDEEGKPIGYLEVVVNQEKIEKDARNTALFFALAAFLQTFLVIWIVTVLYKRKLTEPLTRLALQIKDIQPGTEGRLVIADDQQDNELGFVSEYINSFLETTQAAFNQELALKEKILNDQEQYKRILDTTRICFFALNANEEIINFNQALEKLFEATVNKRLAENKQNFAELFFKNPEDFWKMVLEAIQSRKSISGELSLLARKGQELFVQCSISVIYQPNGELEFVEGVIVDISENLQKLENVKRLAEVDSLTKLKNRQGLESGFKRMKLHALDENACLVVFMIDLDDFKPVNDEFGHAAGDEVLMKIAQRLQQGVHRRSDLACRYGGDEFVLVCEYPNDEYHDFASNMAQSIIDSVIEPIHLQTHPSVVSVKVSIGISAFPHASTELSVLLEKADKAMYQIKSQGKNGFAFSATSSSGIS